MGKAQRSPEVMEHGGSKWQHQLQACLRSSMAENHPENLTYLYKAIRQYCCYNQGVVFSSLQYRGSAWLMTIRSATLQSYKALKEKTYSWSLKLQLSQYPHGNMIGNWVLSNQPTVTSQHHAVMR